jgi:hypothetical protein
MIDSYIILHRKTSIVIKVFIFNIFLIGMFVIWGINTIEYQSYFQIHSKILKFNSYYYLEVLIPVKEVYKITNQNKITIDEKEYFYHTYEIDSNVIYENNQNYQKIYLEIISLEPEYLKNGYQVDVKIPKEKKKIINYLKE